MGKPTILSGMRPTGPLHLGHLVGALENWRDFQDDHRCFYMVADWHALMSEYRNSGTIAQFSREIVAEWIACGIDPERSTIFLQSKVPQHSELYLILSTVTPIGWVERCPTYKEQLRELASKEVNTYAFLGYPVLQAADILLYKADVVPVGDDQLPHLELAREIARRFNSLFTEVFPEPQAKLTKRARLLGLDRRKMSKSYGNFVALADEAQVIQDKVMSMVTDPQRIRRTDPGRPDYCNVHAYYEAFLPELSEEVAAGCLSAAFGCVDCKARLAEGLEAFLEPIRNRRNELLSSPGQLDSIISSGNEIALEEASNTMAEIREAVGF